jgi:hypothetical protein
MTDRVPVTGLTASDNSVTFGYGNLLMAGNSGTVMVSGNLVRLDSTGNVRIMTTSRGIIFPDGTFMSTASSGAAISVTNDTTTNANTYYPSLTNNVTSGTLSALVTSSTKLFYNPSTGALNSTVFNGNSEGGYVSGTVFNARTSLIAATVTSNGAISGTTIGGTVITASTGYEGGYHSGTIFNARTSLIAATVTSNGTVTGTTFVPTGSTVPSNGMYLPAANSVGFATNSSARMQINSTGNVVIGTAFASQARLNVNTPTLASTSNLQTVGQVFYTTNNNADYLEITNTRNGSGGSDWTSAGWRLQEKIDATWMGYIQFNNGSGTSSNNAGISFGTGTSTTNANGVPEVMRITSNGGVGIGTIAPVIYGTTPGLSVHGDSVGFASLMYAGIEGMRLYSLPSENALLTIGARPLQFIQNGSIRMSIDANSNVNIGSGSTVAAGSKLNISGGNVRIETAGRGILFQDGSFMNTASVFIPTGSTTPTNGMFLPTTNTVGFASNSTERMRITSTGNVGIGTTSTLATTQLAVFGGNVQIGTASRGIVFPDGTFMNTAAAGGGGATITNNTSTNSNNYFPAMTNNQTSGTWTDAVTSSTKFYFNPSTGTLNATVFNSLSDAAAKTNIAPILGASNMIDALRGVRFGWRDNSGRSAGLLAQDVEKIMPELVNTSDQGKSLNYNGVIGILVEAIKDLKAELAELKRKIDA